MALINGTAYSWSQIVVQMSNSNLPLFGVSSVEWTKSQEKENIYAAGNRPYARGYGNKNYEGTITLKMADVVGLERESPNSDITEIPRFDLIISFVHPDLTKLVSYVLKDCDFTESSRSIGQNDLSIDVDIPFIFSDEQVV